MPHSIVFYGADRMPIRSIVTDSPPTLPSIGDVIDRCDVVDIVSYEFTSGNGARTLHASVFLSVAFA